MLQLAFVPLGGGSSSIENQTSIRCLSPAGFAPKIALVISCQSRNNPMGASRAYAPSPSRLLTRPGRLRAEEILVYFAPATQRCGFAFLLPENLFAGDQQRPATPPSSVPRPVWRGWHCHFVSPDRIPWPVRAVSRRHSCRFNQHRPQMFVALFRRVACAR